MKTLHSSLAIVVGILFAVGMAGFPEPNRWSETRIIPGVIWGGGLSYSLFRRLVPITPPLLCVLAVILLCLITVEARTTLSFLAASVWSALYFAAMLGIYLLERKEQRVNKMQSPAVQN